MNPDAVILRTRRWIATVVIGLNLCPFARRVFEADRIRYAVSPAEKAAALLADLGHELRLLAASPLTSVETTLLIHPLALVNFLDYNEFLSAGDQLIEDLGLSGIIQIASFHPEYQFAGTEPTAVENYTNRSPYPMLHLLREESVALAIAIAAGAAEQTLEIPRRNIETLRQLGKAKMLEKLKAIDEDSRVVPVTESP